MIHLSVRSSYSLLNGLMSIDDIVGLAKENNMSAVALTDHHVLFGALNFQKACEKQGIKPIFGLEVTIDVEDGHYTSLLLAKNNAGYQGLMHLAYQLSVRKSITLEDILVYNRNLIFIAYSEDGPFESDLLKDNLEAVAENIRSLKERFPSFYVGISHQESSFFHTSNAKLDELARFNDVETVAVPKVYYREQGDEEAFRVVQAIDRGTYLEDKTLVSAPNRFFYTPEAMANMYHERQLKLTEDIAAMCSVDVFAITTRLPHFITNQDVDNATYLSKLSEFGLKKRLGDALSDGYTKRLNYELSVINNMNFTDYFLIVYDIIRYAKKESIYVGPGRGSAAGSLVAYSLGITEIDPIAYDLIFERFLNPERISMPDIDIDFPDDKRHLVIEYVKHKYGDDHVANIVTFGTLRARQAFRDVGRVLQIPIRSVDTGAKLISASYLSENYENVPKFRTFINAEKSHQRCYQLALKVEGLMRHASVHAAGVVLSSTSLQDVVPILKMDEETQVTQYDMVHLEEIGLVKIDFLGLRNLTIIDNISKQINQTKPFNIMKIPLDDTKTFELLSQAETVGVFQLESDGMKALLRKLKPNRFMDIVDTIALYRPGPMENIPMYLSLREHPEQVTYLHPKLKEITESTHGILVYQEQIMQVAQIMAGFTLGKADILRKAMGKKNAKELDSLRDDFIAGCINNGHSEKLAVELFDLVQKFANYGFNKSHSVAYGLIAYQLAYLKANYSHMFYTYLLTSVLGSDVKTRQYIDECRRRNVLLMSPNLELSQAIYTLEGVKIRLPFTLIKGITTATSTMIVSEREKNGSYVSFNDAISRLNLIGIKKAQFESLIKGGAFDYFGYNRLAMLASLEEAIRYANIIKVDRGDEKYLNYGLISEPLFTEVTDNQRTSLNFEKEMLGFYFTEHPVVALKQKHDTDSIVNVVPRDKYYRVIAMVETVKNHRAKNGKMMAFLGISDDTGTMDAVVFPDLYDKVKDILSVGSLVLIKGNIRDKESIIVQDIVKFENN
ncbi:DNA polymerase III subunit alpha [Erysipelothrix sp. HDW6C]|uniref:DNA polymerase III subunit alpha n=1 Tax=Erysipelothrix sp. HDW6C TaxID=2714930 RepID=UPI001408943C|nr:DNA polymerase III subunit alpha [Erysipelothrix sp. HDW6C]QIK70110.1 DNA polymerase III subunit alpha [Erysipelothrix sp. HDW6C]